jgi:hypothetical protein
METYFKEKHVERESGYLVHRQQMQYLFHGFDLIVLLQLQYLFHLLSITKKLFLQVSKRNRCLCFTRVSFCSMCNVPRVMANLYCQTGTPKQTWMNESYTGEYWCARLKTGRGRAALARSWCRPCSFCNSDFNSHCSDKRIEETRNWRKKEKGEKRREEI